MKIGIFTDAYEPLISGVVTSVKTLREGLEALGHDVYIVTTTTNKGYAEDPKVIRFNGIKLPKKSLKGFRYVLFAKRHLKKLINMNFDVVHVHTEFSIGKLALLLKKKTNVPLIYTIHTSYQDYLHHISKFMDKYMHKTSLKIAWKLNNKFSSKADFTITPTKKIFDKVNDLKHDGNFVVIPSGINLKPFYKETYTDSQVKEVRRSLGIKDDEFVALIVARISKEKSINDLVDAFIPFRKQYPNSKFIIIGDGPDKSELEKYIKKLGASDYIKAIGFVKWGTVGLYYQIGDCFLNASTTETQGLTYIEALAASLPAFIRYDKVFDDFIQDGYNGIFFNKTEELTDILIRVQKETDILKNLSNNARETVNPYSQEKYALKCEKLYTDAIKKIDNNKEKVL